MWEAHQEVRHEVVDEFDTVDRLDDVAVSHDNGRAQPSDAFLDWAEPREVAADYDNGMPEVAVGPSDVEQTREGWGLTDPAEQRVTDTVDDEETLDEYERLYF